VGLVSDVVAEDEIANAGRAIAREILGNSPVGVRLTKECLNMSVDAPSLESAIAMEDRQQILASTTGDMREGVSAFLEKRAPEYKDA
jgi:enoyl-CoA hydratase